MKLSRLIENYRTEILGFLVAFVLISAGIIFPNFIPDQVNAPPGFQDTTWIKNLISYLLIGMGLVCFFWLVIIHRFMVHKSKKDYMY